MERDPYEYFRVEAREILEGLGRGVLQLEKGATPEAVAELLRLAHTLKGAARVVKQRAIAESAHAIEGELSPMRQTRVPLAGQQITAILALLDTIAAGLVAIDAPPRVVVDGAGDVRCDRPRNAPVDDTLRAVRSNAAEMEALVDGATEAGQQLRIIRRALGPLAHARHLADLLDRAEREMGEVRDAAEKLRLVPVRTLFVPLERTARDVAQSLGRATDFEAKGADVRLEAQVLVVVQGALVQLVRNAIAHGVEPAAERIAAGKSASGLVEIEVVRSGNRIIFICRDDGGGVDLEAVRRVAEERRLLGPGGSPIDADQLLKLLVEGGKGGKGGKDGNRGLTGLTTSAEVTEVSGRGIGLDVVREAATQLGGEITVQTETGRGTTFKLAVPVSLSSLDALLVESSGMSIAIPLDAVRRTIRLNKRDLARTADGDTIVHDGRVIPFVPLSVPLGGKAAPGWDGGARSAVVVDGGTALTALGVDRLAGIATVIVRPLPMFAPADPLIAGATLDGEGTPRLVLDPSGLVGGAFRTEQPFGVPAPASPPPVLVIDDSLTTRMLEQSILESAGYTVELATSAEEGLEKARQRPYRLFLVDVEMPGMDGFAFVRTTRADPILREVPAILVTSRNAPEDRRRGVEAGASGYVVKGDFDQGQLLALIQRVVH